MSFDDGVPNDVDVFGVKSRMRAAMFDRGITMSALQTRSQVTQEDLERAFATVEIGNPEAFRVLSLTANAIGVSPQWVLMGTGESPLSAVGRIVRLAWEFVYRSGLSVPDGKQFEAWLRGRFGQPAINANGANELFRNKAPQKLLDIGPLYDNFRREMRSR